MTESLFEGITTSSLAVSLHSSRVCLRLKNGEIKTPAMQTDV